MRGYVDVQISRSFGGRFDPVWVRPSWRVIEDIIVAEAPFEWSASRPGFRVAESIRTVSGVAAETERTTSPDASETKFSGRCSRRI